MGNEPGTESHQMPQAQAQAQTHAHAQAQAPPTRSTTANQSRASVPAQVPPQNLNKSVSKQSQSKQSHTNGHSHSHSHGHAAHTTSNNGSQSHSHAQSTHAYNQAHTQPHHHVHAYQQQQQNAYQQYTHSHQSQYAHHPHAAPQKFHQHQYYHHLPPSSKASNAENKNTANHAHVQSAQSKNSSNSTSNSNGSNKHQVEQTNNNQQSQKPQQHMTNNFEFSKKLTIADFEMVKLVGKGSFGQVWQVSMKKNQEIYALKILKKKDLVARKQVDHTNTERRILANIDHPFLVSLRFAFQTKTKLFMVMDFFNGGELFFHLQKVGKFAEHRAKFYAAEICLAIECLHRNGITYRDLKPENILLDHDGHIKITDFGLSKDHLASNDNGILRTFCGSPEYLAPEMLLQNGYNHMVDWWSFGTILYEMICGLPPFYDTNIQQMYQNILYKPVPFYKFMSPGVIDLISRLLDKSPATRIQCRQTKRHAFFHDIDWDKLYKKEMPPPWKPTVRGKHDASNFEQMESSMDRQRQYLHQTPSIKTHSLIAAENQFPNFTYDETTNNAAADSMICID